MWHFILCYIISIQLTHYISSLFIIRMNIITWVFIINLFTYIQTMIDPRPYTYEYRKPRLSNPTYRSSNMYDSLYHLRFPSHAQFILSKEKKNYLEKNHQSTYKPQNKSYVLPQRPKIQSLTDDVNKSMAHSRQNSLYSKEPINYDQYIKNSSLNKQIQQKVDSKLPDFRQNNSVQSQLSNYGQNLMKSAQLNRFSIYEKQQKGFNIINFQPKEMANSLRNFPKFTLQDKLIENGRYHRV